VSADIEARESAARVCADGDPIDGGTAVYLGNCRLESTNLGTEFFMGSGHMVSLPLKSD